MTVTKHSEGRDRGGWPEPGAGEVSVEKRRRDAGRKTGDGELQKGQQRSPEPAGETTQTVPFLGRGAGGETGKCVAQNLTNAECQLEF